jgi:tRNA(fMet)-specific endonuclease VapC
MPGDRYLLDTNALVALLQGHKGVLDLVHKARWLGVSVINVLEFLGFDGLSESDRALFMELTARLAVVDLNHGNIALMERITDLRKTRAVKLPDAIVMGSAALYNATVITNDAVLLKLDGVAAGFAAQSF